MNEAQITAAVLAHWRALALPGTLVAAIPNMRAAGQYGLTPGLPDLLVIAPGLPVGLLELKTEKGRLSAPQRTIATLCAYAGAPYAVTYGRDEPIAVLERWGAVRRVTA